MSAFMAVYGGEDQYHAALAAYEWRYNRRFDLSENLGPLARVAVATKPAPYALIAAVRSKKYRRLAETHG